MDDAEKEMTAQVTSLSTKLLEAIDTQADLEDQIQVMRKELDALRRENMNHEDQVRLGQLVPASDLALEKHKRVAAEAQVSKLQGEIEELTSSLFDEANRMVADAKRETSAIERRNEQLTQQLHERDVLLENLQEQLAGLKEVLQEMTDDGDDNNNNNIINSNLDSATEGINYIEEKEATEDGDLDTVDSGTAAAVVPEVHPDDVLLNNYSFVRPIVRHDLQNYREFLLMIPEVVESPRTSLVVDSSILKPVTTTSSGGSITSNHISALTARFSSSHTTTNGSNNGTSGSSGSSSSSGLKDFKFFKRSLADDIEPTLRLDTAPGLSWLSRRNIMSSIIDGSIIIEPIATANEGYKLKVSDVAINSGSSNTVKPESDDVYVASYNGLNVKPQLISNTTVQTTLPIATRSKCSLCGENRDKSLLYARLHNLRTGKENNHNSISSLTDSEELLSSSATIASGSGATTPTSTSPATTVSSGHPLCFHCLQRVRTVCDYISFIRGLRLGLWKGSKLKAWEECMQLRERMFWARNGGFHLKDGRRLRVVRRGGANRESYSSHFNIREDTASVAASTVGSPVVTRYSEISKPGSPTSVKDGSGDEDFKDAKEESEDDHVDAPVTAAARPIVDIVDPILVKAELEPAAIVTESKVAEEKETDRS
ncbi:hypothetical protein D0Z00_002536 [Geotrichum galactomycetum]|uniref:Uncharacterized protein n=1 Tax=Geotrichum galactomycetum TaxID=27317 RepID=A0ACB6V3U7_9ASCO|nr:hypothetical protein D0Z00_002536 [Geotrichum candidum]